MATADRSLGMSRKQSLELKTAEIDDLNIIHVAGTKGKGSTCAFIESFLRAYGERTGWPAKTGLYTSPHLIYPEERIRINFKPINRDLFAMYFFEVWGILSQEPERLPRYLQLLALVSFHAFIKEGVEAAVLETHHGGEYDATNVIEHPVATVITALGMDHVQQLGPTIEDIAWHKSGIFKRGAYAFSSPQEPSAADILRNRASEKGINIHSIGNDPDLPIDMPQLKPDVQRTNCSVALAAVRCFLGYRAPKDLPLLSDVDVSQAISQFSWPGRFQIIVDGVLSWFLDGAHNEMSVSKAAEWFIENSQGENASPVRILVFSQISKQRDAKLVLERLAAALSPIHIDHVIFTLYDPQQDLDSPAAVVDESEDALQQAFGEIWSRYHQDSRIVYELSVEKALDAARELGTEAGGMQTLITGSQHLVGSALFSINRCASTRDRQSSQRSP
ncbi:uncharacterized protein J4E87_004301 [Alternaria ethzedia]|uniref:uncharacterized protein n=1 Tax=Alternaria ethzedia TaxID=181014 RepID=UPI0020C5753B|nr:uncharacterized protein J4E87_004301 [Alternaria ethzedia]KAI4626960.1 hypothetical protein J4E87_004301 [Alternaria ethzedia]